MSRIRAKDTSPEILVRKYLHSKGFRFRLHDKKLPGKPDIVLPKYRTIININGCFWHGHEGCRYFKFPLTNIDYWTKKISGNVERDKIAYQALQENGWKVLIIWECTLKNASREETLHDLTQSIKD